MTKLERQLYEDFAQKTSGETTTGSVKLCSAQTNGPEFGKRNGWTE